MSLQPSDFEEIVKIFPSADASDNPAYVYIAVIFECIGHEPLVSDLWTWISHKFPEETEQALVARKLREGLLKASVLVGFPRGINGLTALRNGISNTSPELQKLLDKDESLRQAVPKRAREDRGKAFFAKVYAQHTDRVLKNMTLNSGGDLAEFAIDCVYGDLMAETSILSEKDTGLLEFACCYASGASPQAKGHMYGSRNLGNGKAEVIAVMEMCEQIAKKLGLPMKREGEEAWTFLQKLDTW